MYNSSELTQIFSQWNQQTKENEGGLKSSGIQYTFADRWEWMGVRNVQTKWIHLLALESIEKEKKIA